MDEESFLFKTFRKMSLSSVDITYLLDTSTIKKHLEIILITSKND
jgi:hypothetical protein